MASAAPADSRDPASDLAETAHVRALPDGKPCDATLVGWNGDAMRLELSDRDAALGGALEVEAGSVLYWGELRSRDGSCCWIRVEHSLDRATLALDRKRWG